MKLKKIIVMMVLLTTAICTIGQSVMAVTQELIDLNRKANLTVIKYEHANGNKENKQLKDVEFTIYQVPSNKENVEEAETYIKQNSIEGISKTTGTDGKAEFTNLNIGRYLVVETKAPKNVTTKIESFLIDLPRSNESGKWEYDVTVQPKNVTYYGKVVLTNNDDNGNPIKGAEWILQKQDSNGNWQDYPGVDTLTTDDNGQISVRNLEIGSYNLVPIKVPKGYILEKYNTATFTITKTNLNVEFEATTKGLNIEKFIKLSDGNYGSKVGAFRTDTNSWKIEANVPNIITNMNKYCIIDSLPEGLIYKQNTLKVYGDENELTLNEDYTLSVENQKMTIDFTTENLGGYEKLTIKYDTNFDYENVESGNYVNSTNLIYSNSIEMNGNCENSTEKTEDKSATVYTGELVCYKTDEEGAPLNGAKFKIATSKQNAENGLFVKDNNGDDFVAISDGYFRFYGLKLGKDNQDYSDAVTSYWIVEIESPTYEENGEIKHYNLLENPVEVQVTSASGHYTKDSTTVINKKGFKLPLTGGVLNIIPLLMGITMIIIAVIIPKKKTDAEK